MGFNSVFKGLSTCFDNILNGLPANLIPDWMTVNRTSSHFVRWDVTAAWGQSTSALLMNMSPSFFICMALWRWQRLSHWGGRGLRSGWYFVAHWALREFITVLKNFMNCYRLDSRRRLICCNGESEVSRRWSHSCDVSGWSTDLDFSNCASSFVFRFGPRRSSNVCYSY